MKYFQSALALLITLSIVSAAPAQEKKLTTVNLGYSAISGSFAPLWVGFDQGLFANASIATRITREHCAQDLPRFTVGNIPPNFYHLLIA